MNEPSTFVSPLFILLASIPGLTWQNLCPDPGDILPCTSAGADADNVIVDCSAVASSDQIFSTFNDAEFRLYENPAVKEIPEGAFGEISFKVIDLQASAVGSVHPSAHIPSGDRLHTLFVWSSALAEFPWDALERLTRLEVLWLEANALTTLGSFQSSSLQILQVSVNQIASSQAGCQCLNRSNAMSTEVFVSCSDDADGIHRIHLQVGIRCRKSCFDDLETFEEFSCSRCSLGSTLFDGSFQLRSQNVQSLYLDNFIASPESHAITGFSVNAFIGLSFNAIAELREGSFRPMLEVVPQGNCYLSFYANPIACDCSMDWIVLRPDFLQSVEGHCTDGTEFHNLDPQDFLGCLAM
ncbi:unnamed protein product [Darwinula stevensoni]|uniref:Uncharacterized protein n=1 Tax=Darwinula stevensoni TaxID=69355 RepID=A0A7R9FT23_9CRUS|nr:unnamed protein product [Darwinula stevensoni]CAG0905169.1 unnamed protein product [Darwinula stevensoni]